MKVLAGLLLSMALAVDCRSEFMVMVELVIRTFCFECPVKGF